MNFKLLSLALFVALSAARPAHHRKRCNDSGTSPSNSTSPGGASNSTSSYPANTAFVGSNLYYAAGLSSDTRTYFLGQLQAAGVKVLRVWLDGQGGSPKGTSITSYPGLEPNSIGTYDDTVLQLLDTFMIDANKYGVKLMISMHSYNVLSGGGDAYKQWGDPAFYTDSDATAAFDARLQHVLNHNHTTLGKPWKELNDYIFAFEAQNEAMIGDGADFIASHTGWQCDRAKTIKTTLGDNSGILVTTGGESYADESAQDAFFQCEYLDIIAIHAYGEGDFDESKISGIVSKAKSAGKMTLMQEWGVCYWNGSNNCHSSGGVVDSGTRWSNLAAWNKVMLSQGMPTMYWQLIPNDDPHNDWDYEIGMTDSAGFGAFVDSAKTAQSYSSPWDWSQYLL